MTRVNSLSLSELDRRIHELEKKYRIATVEFLKNSSARAAISEDDLLMWETYVDFKRELRQLEKRVQGRYLERISQHGDRKRKAADMVELAA